MLCVVIDQQALLLEDRVTPSPGPGHVLIATTASGINAADILQRRGHYPAPAGWPVDVPGLELAGHVVAVGPDVDPQWMGRHVCAIVGGGAQASHVLVPADHLLVVPEGVAAAEAGGFAEAFLTAYDALVLQAQLRAGERVLISGASGGVGTAAVQIARHLGAHVTAVTRSAHHGELRALGADEVCHPDQVSDVAPVDVVLELVGASNLQLVLGRLAPFARVVVIGLGGGNRLDLDLRILMATRATLTGSTLRSRSHEEKSALAQRVREELLPAWATGALRVMIAGTFPLTEPEAAYAFFAQPGKFGKVVLTQAAAP